MIEPEWVEETPFTGDGMTKQFQSTFRVGPLVEDSLVIDPTPQTIQFRPGGSYFLIYETPPPENTKLKVRYAWRPPRLRDARVCVELPGGLQEWVSILELRDAIQRGGMKA